jgi:hypothetical protein
MKNQDEYKLQTAVCDYLRAQYPNALFLSDTVASVKLTMPQAVRNKRIQCPDFKCPDLLILETRQLTAMAEFYGLFIELKKESPYLKDGMTIKASQNDHLKLQWESILKLRKRGYFADWVWTWAQAIKTIDWYLGEKK